MHVVRTVDGSPCAVKVACTVKAHRNPLQWKRIGGNENNLPEPLCMEITERVEYGYVPNHGEASVSKVNLVTGEAVARYWTAPRLEDEVDFEGNPNNIPNIVDPRAWRTSRIDMDYEGNAWVINTGADEDRYDGDDLIGSIVRIQWDTDGLTTNDNHGNPMDFGDDQAVQVFQVGEAGDVPRVIVIDEDYIWVGFYEESYFQKYEYSNGNLNTVGGIVESNDFDFAPYDAKMDKDGIIWFTGRGRGDVGVYSLNPENNTIERHAEFNPYALVVDNDREVVWVTDYDDGLYEFPINDPDNPTKHTIDGAEELRGLALDTNDTLWLASSDNGKVIQFLPDVNGGIVGQTYETEYVRPVGLGLDPLGFIWVVMRDDDTFRVPNDPGGGFIEKFNPLEPGLKYAPHHDHIQVGLLPYAYGNYTAAYKICQ